MKSTQVGSGPEKDGFTFDRVFPMGTKQHEVFDYGVKESVFPCFGVLMLD
jgi:kinesin family protein 5